MAACTAVRTCAVLQFLQRGKKRDYMKEMNALVKKYEGITLELKSPADASWKICGLRDTCYHDQEDVVDEWGQFYLRDEVEMQVLGVVEESYCPWDPLILMTCEDRKLYAFDEEELHEVASSLEKLFNEGLQYPGSKRYYKGEAFRDMTKEDWDEVRRGDSDKTHNDLVKAGDPPLLSEKMEDKGGKTLMAVKREREASVAPTPPPIPPKTRRI